jgi:hypothetical protein
VLVFAQTMPGAGGCCAVDVLVLGVPLLEAEGALCVTDGAAAEPDEPAEPALEGEDDPLAAAPPESVFDEDFDFLCFLVVVWSCEFCEFVELLGF